MSVSCHISKVLLVCSLAETSPVFCDRCLVFEPLTKDVCYFFSFLMLFRIRGGRGGT